MIEKTISIRYYGLRRFARLSKITWAISEAEYAQEYLKDCIQCGARCPGKNHKQGANVGLKELVKGYTVGNLETFCTGCAGMLRSN